MTKRVWISMLGQEESSARELYSKIQEFGLTGQGHFWKDDLENMEWFAPVNELSDLETGIWIIYGSSDDFSKKSIRQGLSLLTLAVQDRRKGLMSTVILCDQEISKEDLPWSLQQSLIIKPDNPSLGAKITAKANLPDKKPAREYRLGCYVLPKIGLWLEVGPAYGDWKGIVFGVCGTAVEAMGVGEKGKIPEKSVLAYPVRDMQLSLGEKDYTAWACQNVLSQDDSAYFKLQGIPEGLVFGGYESEDENPELFHINLV